MSKDPVRCNEPSHDRSEDGGKVQAGVSMGRSSSAEEQRLPSAVYRLNWSESTGGEHFGAAAGRNASLIQTERLLTLLKTFLWYEVYSSLSNCRKNRFGSPGLDSIECVNIML